MGMSFGISARTILHAVLVCFLLFGPAIVFASPMAPSTAGKTVMLGNIAHDAKAGCVNCTEQGGKGTAAVNCNGACPWLVALPVVAVSSQRSVKPAWIMMPALARRGISQLVEPYPPKSPSQI